VKKILMLTLIVALMVTMLFIGTSCKEEKATTEEVTEEEVTEEEVAEETTAAGALIGVTMPTKSLQRWNQDGANIKAQLEAKGYTVDLQYAEDSVATQVSQLENQITMGAKVLIIASIDGSALGEVLKSAKEAGIATICYDRLIKETADIDYNVTFDNFQVGVLQGEYIETALGLKEGNGPFNMEIFAGSPDDNNATLFYNGELSVLQQYIDSGMLVIPSGQTDFLTVATPGWKAETAQARMDNLITANYADGTVLDVICCPNDSTAIGSIAALDNVGYGTADKPYPIITGQDADIPNTIAMIDGKQSMSVFKDTRILAEQAVAMVDAILKGGEVPVNNTTDYDNGVKIVPSFLCTPIVVTKDNYEEALIDSGYYTVDQITK